MGKSIYGKASKPIDRHLEYVIIGGGEAKKLVDEAVYAKLDADKTTAHRIGRVMKLAREDFARAYPNETRQKRIPNAKLEAKGFDALAKLNRLMGLSGS